MRFNPFAFMNNVNFTIQTVYSWTGGNNTENFDHIDMVSYGDTSFDGPITPPGNHYLSGATGTLNFNKGYLFSNSPTTFNNQNVTITLQNPDFIRFICNTTIARNITTFNVKLYKNDILIIERTQNVSRVLPVCPSQVADGAFAIPQCPNIIIGNNDVLRLEWTDNFS
jgi:hypothetical protein